MAYQEITIKKRTRKKDTSSTQSAGAKPTKNRRQHITRNNSTPSKVCPRCGGTGRVKS